MTKYLAAAAALFFSTSAHAYIYVGNPDAEIIVDRSESDLTSGIATLKGIRVHKCGGGYDDYTVEETADPTDEGWTVNITGGDLCGISVKWDSDVLVSSSAFTLRYEEVATSVFLTGTVNTALLDPVVVQSGTFSGSTPVVRIEIQ